MKQLFIRFYVGVLAVLLLAWWIHGYVLQYRDDTDRARVVATAFGGGARMVANELEAALENRHEVLKRIQSQFLYPVEIRPIDELPSHIQRHLSSPGNIASLMIEQSPDVFQSGREVVVIGLTGGSEYVRLGPFPKYSMLEIEDSLGGWISMCVAKADEQPDAEQAIADVRGLFDFPVVVENKHTLPDVVRNRLDNGHTVAFYSDQSSGVDRWFAASALHNSENALRFGPFPDFDRGQKAATTTLALVLLPAALAIALLLRPVAQQLRHIENAAKAIAAGDLSARVDERHIGSAKPLANAFNDMAIRTEAMVRTQRELLQAVSHELRTPLSRMKFAIDLVGTAKNDDERRQRLNSIDAAVEDINELVDELLRYVTLETGTPTAHGEPLAVIDTVKILLQTYSELYPAINFTGLGDQQREVMVFADQAGFQRALGNLMSNAGRHARSQVTVSVTQLDQCIAIDIDDDGSGIPESERARVFEPFVRLDTQPSSSSSGVGLGLAIVQRIVSQNGGHAQVLTSPVGGCRVRTTWPSV